MPRDPASRPAMLDLHALHALPDSALLRRPEAAALARVSESRFDGLRHEYSIPEVRLGRKVVRFRKGTILALLARLDEQEPAAPRPRSSAA